MEFNFILADDKEQSLNSTVSYIRRSIETSAIDGKIVLITKYPQDVIDYSNAHYDEINVYILDINFNDDINGFGVACSIREKEPHAYIIFLTVHAELTMLTFKYRLKAFDFLVKPVTFIDIEECLKALKRDFESILRCHIPVQEKYISIKSAYREHRVSLNDIIYIESYGPKFIIHLKDGILESYGALREIQTFISQSSDLFYRIHKSYLINLKAIWQINLKESILVMSNGEKCPIARSKREFIREYLNEGNIKG